MASVNTYLSSYLQYDKKYTFLFIDDVKLSEVISPRAKSKLSMPAGVSLTPFAKHEHLLSQEDREILKQPQATIQKQSVTVYIPVETEIPCIEDQRCKKRPRQPSSDSSSQASQISSEDSLNSPPAKFEYAVKTIESPQGDFKLKINRTLKPKNRSLETATAQAATTHQRISRRASLQMGISPGKILQLQTQSPSPMKKVKTASTKNKENKYSPLSSAALFHLTTSPILNMPNGRRASKDSPSRKRRRVSKKLYE